MHLAPRSDAFARTFFLLLLALLPVITSCKSLTNSEPDVRVIVGADGTARIDGQRVAIPDLPITLRQLGITRDSEVEVLVHDDAPLRYVAEILSAFGAVGFSPGQVKSKPLDPKTSKKSSTKSP